MDGAEGFLTIFGTDVAESDSPTDNQAVDASAAPDGTTAAEPSAPDGSADQDLTAEELVAARFAASLDADGIEAPEPGEDADEDDAEETHPLLAEADGDTDLDSLTPEQLRSLAEEALALRQEVSKADRSEVARKVAAAEQQAVAQVQSAYEREVLQVSAQHYDRIYQDRLERIEVESERFDDPKAYRKAQSARLRAQVDAAQRQWEAEQTPAYNERAYTSALAARKQVPELRQLYAQELVTQKALPPAAVAELLKVKNTDDFADRADELVGIRDLLVKREQVNRTKVKQEANKRLAANSIRTPSTGRTRGGKPPEYKGTAEEGAHILGMMHRR